MTTGQQKRRETTEEMRRQQQADKRVRELEKLACRYLEATSRLRHMTQDDPESQWERAMNEWTEAEAQLRKAVKKPVGEFNALEGGGEAS